MLQSSKTLTKVLGSAVFGVEATTITVEVIEGFVTDEEGPFSIHISKTVDFYDTNTFAPQENAVIRIFDDQENEDMLTETSPGVYEISNLQGERGVTYTLEGQIEGTTPRPLVQCRSN